MKTTEISSFRLAVAVAMLCRNPRPSAKSTLEKRQSMSSKKFGVMKVPVMRLLMGLYCYYGCHSALATMTAAASSDDSVDRMYSRFFERMENDVLSMAKEVEGLFMQTGLCNATELNSCSMDNYDHCSSSYSPITSQCTDDINFRDKVCGPTDSNCSVLCDFSTTTIRLPAALQDGPLLNPTDPAVIESICFTRSLTSWIANKYAADTSSWKADFGVQPRSYYFGSVTGSFRVFPGRRSPTCGAYDPRVRPWYVAASSGPKNVILMLDISGSMSGQRLSLLQQAAKKIVSTLTVGDRVGIVPFHSEAAQVLADNNGQYLYTANAAKKDILTKQIDTLKASGATNFAAGFTAAFDLLDRSIDSNTAVACTTSILFFTDGTMTLPRDTLESDVIHMVQNRITQSSAKLGGGNAPILLFTYSITDDPENAGPDRFPSHLACSVPMGVWSKIESEDKIVSSLSGYTSLLSLGLGNGANSKFVAWTEPYNFASNNALGTSVAVPVYDRRSEPSLFLGVVAMDIALDALESIALSSTTSTSSLSLSSSTETSRNGTAEAIQRVIAKSTAVCPVLNLTTCTLESFRLNTVGKQRALCTNECSNGTAVNLKLQTCQDQNPSITYPTNLWINTNDIEKSYEESVCCLVGEHVPSTQCLAAAAVPVTSAASSLPGARSKSTLVLILLGVSMISLLLASW